MRWNGCCKIAGYRGKLLNHDVIVCCNYDLSEKTIKVTVSFTNWENGESVQGSGRWKLCSPANLRSKCASKGLLLELFRLYKPSKMVICGWFASQHADRLARHDRLPIMDFCHFRQTRGTFEAVEEINGSKGQGLTGPIWQLLILKKNSNELLDTFGYRKLWHGNEGDMAMKVRVWAQRHGNEGESVSHDLLCQIQAFVVKNINGGMESKGCGSYEWLVLLLNIQTKTFV